MQNLSQQFVVNNGTATEWSGNDHLQTQWDWRAVGNFIGGGAGAGLLVSAVLTSRSIPSYRLQAFLGLAVIALGLLCIMAKMGRPTRAFNIFRHVESSWMTREGFAIPPLFGCGLLSIVQGKVDIVAIVAALSALFFLYCQTRILRGAKGIPVWSEPKLTPLLIATGLAEGFGIAALSSLLLPGTVSLLQAVLLLGALVLRHIAWHLYQRALTMGNVPGESLDVLREFGGNFEVWGQWLPAALLIAGIVLGDAALNGLAATAGLIASVSGWRMKYVLITRAGFYSRKSLSLAGLSRRRP